MWDSEDFDVVVAGMWQGDVLRTSEHINSLLPCFPEGGMILFFMLQRVTLGIYWICTMRDRTRHPCNNFGLRQTFVSNEHPSYHRRD